VYFIGTDVIKGYQITFQGVNRLKREADLSRPTRAEVTNEWIRTSTLHIHLQDVDRHNFYFTFLVRGRLEANKTFTFKLLV
jgi:hypothetical protein